MNSAVTITLNFKSIDAARQALLEIPSSSLVGYVDTEAAAPAPAPEPETKKPVKAQKADAPSQATAKAGDAPTKTAEEKSQPAASVHADAPASTAATAEKIDYSVLQKAVFVLAGKSREAATSVAAALGVKTFKELPDDRWAEALGAVNAKLAELEAA